MDSNTAFCFAVFSFHRNLLSFIRLWLNQFPEGLRQPSEFSALKKLIVFIESSVSHDDRDLLPLAKKVLEDFVSEKCTTHREEQVDVDFGVFSHPPQQVAEHLTFLASVSLHTCRTHVHHMCTYVCMYVHP